MLKFLGNKRSVDQARVALAQYNRMWPVTMKEIPRAEWPTDFIAHVKHAPAVVLRTWRSSAFIAVLYHERGKDAFRLSVQRTKLTDAGELEDGITWDELMRVKGECGFGDQDALELYPREVNVVNVANMRHLWILPSLHPLAWRADTKDPLCP